MIHRRSIAVVDVPGTACRRMSAAGAGGLSAGRPALRPAARRRIALAERVVSDPEVAERRTAARPRNDQRHPTQRCRWSDAVSRELAESVGFEPTRPVTRPSGFQDHCGSRAED